MMIRKQTDIKIWDKYWNKLGRQTQRLHTEIIKAIERNIKLKDKSILEMGAGSGLTSLALAKEESYVVAVDLFWESIKVILDNDRKKVLKVIHADVFNLPFKDGSFDVVFHQGLIEHFKNPKKILKEQMRVLKKGGVFLIDVPQKFSTYTLMKHRLVRYGKWYAGWETEYSIFGLKRMIRCVEDYKLKIISSFGYGTWGILTRIRYLHYRGNVRFGHPVLPKPIFNIYETIWRIIENSFLMKFIAVNICVVGLKE